MAGGKNAVAMIPTITAVGRAGGGIKTRNDQIVEKGGE